MLFHAFSVSSLLIASALAAAEPMPKPYKIGKMSMNPAFGLMRRQAGYAPTQTICGPGTDCASSCGAGYIQCPSTDGDMHCYDPVIKESCCTDGTGNSCSDGYFCTEDASGGSWCCPDGMSLAACAAAYSLTGVLISETVAPTATPSGSPATVSASASTSVYKTEATTTVMNTYTTTTSSYSSSSTVIYSTPLSNVTVSKTSSSLPVAFTGGANAQAVLAGVPAMALAAVGAVFAL